MTDTTSPAATAEDALCVIAEMIAKPGQADALRALILPFASTSRDEPGCHDYTLMEVESEPGRFMTFERWSGHAALADHMKTPAMKSLGPRLGELLSAPLKQTFLREPASPAAVTAVSAPASGRPV